MMSVGTPISVPQTPSATHATPVTALQNPRSQPYPPTFPPPWVFPDWGYFAAGLLTPDADGGRRVIPEAPWPAHPQGFLLWLAESDAQPWVPTAAELTAEGDRLWRARSAAHNETQAEYHKRRLGTSKEV